MPDNLKQIKEFKDTVLDPDGGPESVKVVDHNSLEEQIINSLGRYTGFPFVAKMALPTGVALPLGSFYWNGNAMNLLTPFIIYFTAKSVDGYLVTPVSSILTAGSIMKYKDYVGRAAIFVINSVSEHSDSGGNPYIGLNVTGYAGNPNYTFSINEAEPAFIEFIVNANDVFNPYKAGVFTLFQRGYQGTVKNEGAGIMKNDICISFRGTNPDSIPDAGVFGFFQYDGSGNDQDENNYILVNTTVVNIA